MSKSSRQAEPFFRKFGIGLIVLAALFLLLFLGGGSSRPETASLIFLWPVTILAGTWAFARDRDLVWQKGGTPFKLAVALAVLIALQLVPLPPAMWQAIPGREFISTIEEGLALEGMWRPLTISPAFTWNAFFASLVPLSIIAISGLLDRNQLRLAVVILICIAALSSIVGLFQMTGAGGRALYFYKYYTEGFPIGFLANRNHSAVFLACSLLSCGWYFSAIGRRDQAAGLRAVLTIGAMALFFALILILGSRMGIVLAGLALALAAPMMLSSDFIPAEMRIGSRLKVRKSHLAGLLIAGFLMLAGASIALARSLTFQRLIQEDPAQELRVQLLPVYWQMIKDFMPFGAGFGTFERAYRLVEPTDQLRFAYLNEAHNDWAQLAIEGGLPAILLAMVFLTWLAMRTVRLIRAEKDTSTLLGLHAAGVIVLLLAAAVTDYALRLPSLIAYFAFMCVLLERAVHRKRDSL